MHRDNTRKSSRKATNTDLMHMLLINSDPLISSMCQCSTYSKTNREDLPEGVRMLLVAPEVVDADNDDNDTTNTAESDTDSDDSI